MQKFCFEIGELKGLCLVKAQVADSAIVPITP
jgi:hypothetical protein